MSLGWGKLGKDFWLFRFGQIISVLGDSCSHIALAWWILDATESPAQMSAVLAPAMFMRIFLLPLLGPIGDKFPRKWLIFISDIWRGVFTFAIGTMIVLNYFNLPLLITLYIVNAVGSAIFSSVAGSIVPQLVSAENLPVAMRQSEAITAVGGIVGGIAGGGLVTIFGLAGAFYVDAGSYMLSAILVLFIRANTRPPLVEGEKTTEKSALGIWFEDLKEGFVVMYKIPVMFWMSIVAMMLNFVLSPIGIILPVLVKQERNLPPWFLGALESSVGLGSILGAIIIGWLCKKMLTDVVVVMGIVFIGIGIGFMPWVPSIALPLSMMFLIGVGAALANIPMSTKEALATPDQYRSRINSIGGFQSMLAAPIGVAVAGVVLEKYGLNYTLMGIGTFVVILCPLMFLIPHFSKFMRSEGDETTQYFKKNFPKAFD
jgi:MFS transporter, DHA3 family, macrolide efflux protein